MAALHPIIQTQRMEPMIPDDDVEVLAQDMIKHFPTDAALRATMRSDALSVLGYAEKSKKWVLVRAEIEKIQAGQRLPTATYGGPCSPALPVGRGGPAGDAKKKGASQNER